MNLSSALRLAPGDVVAFVGGGGKTTAMFRLADEIVSAGGQVITTTTTRIALEQTRLAPLHLQSPADLRAALHRSPHVLLTGAIDSAEDKAPGLPPDSICVLHSAFSNLIILVEADGARLRPFKAPTEHEPVIPQCATIVVPVVGIDVIGKPLTAKFVHRPEAVARIHPGVTASPEMVAAVLAHPSGGRKNIPVGARAIVFINKVGSDEGRLAAAQIVGFLRERGGIDAVMVGAAAMADPVIEVFHLTANV
ncbi:MAG: putative selenium-dependent hydroxylase accessory protein YqeC [Chloroflexi bacterium]|nr:putative selenium-dependent hydroxylase accessory protein YqeC [Chloroflexota bacterium]